MNALADFLQNPPAAIWPLAMLLFMLVMLHQLREKLHPLTTAVVGGLAKDAGRNSKMYATAFAFGVSASLSAWVDAFKDLTADQAAAMSYWQLSAVFARILNPFIVAVLAYAYRVQSPASPSMETMPPFGARRDEEMQKPLP